jgi:tRNA modification GTPase
MKNDGGGKNRVGHNRYNVGMNEIIVAISTPLSFARRGILRLSGPGCQACLHDLLHVVQGEENPFEARLREPFFGIPVSLYHFPRGASYTGEEMVELHLPSNPHLLQELKVFLQKQGIREARAGEFTRRALESGRMSFFQAQALLQLLKAENAASHREALEVLGRKGDNILNRFQAFLQEALLSMENDLDFDEKEEGLLEAAFASGFYENIEIFWNKLKPVHAGEDSPRVLLWGRTNAGKSTLFNALGGDALVSKIKGSTRDFLELELEWGGIAFVLVDTPGWGGPEDAVDLKAQKMAQREKEKATVLLRLGRLKDKDESTDMDWYTCRDELPPPWPENSLSVFDGGSLEAFQNFVIQKLSRRASSPQFTVARVTEIEALLFKMKKEIRENEVADFVVLSSYTRELLRLIHPLGLEVQPEDLLNELFSRFCVGK